MGSSLGHSLRAFKSAIAGEDEDEAEPTKSKKVKSSALDEDQS
jgi:Sec-independent protein translocase protein TatA